jgi:hypothetical protein
MKKVTCPKSGIVSNEDLVKNHSNSLDFISVA